jgi:YVTN family beta-propeller protein
VVAAAAVVASLVGSGTVPVREIEVGDGPVGIAVTPDGARAYVANSAAGSLSVVDTAGESVTATIRVADNTNDVVLSPDGSRGYVVGDGSVWTLDPSSGAVARLDVEAGFAAAFSPDGSSLYVAGYVLDSGLGLQVLDTATNSVRAVVPIPDEVHDIAVAPDGSRVYLLGSVADRVTVVDVSAGSVAGTIQVADAPYHLALSPDGSRLYVPGTLGDAVPVIDTATSTVVATVEVDLPAGVAVGPGGRHLYVFGYAVVRVDRLDGSTTTLALASGGGAAALVGPERLYVLNPRDDTVSVLDLAGA